MTNDDLRYKSTDRNGADHYEYTGSDPHLMGADVKIIDQKTPEGQVRLVEINTPPDVSGPIERTTMKRHIYVDGKTREYYERTVTVDRERKTRESSSFTNTVDENGQIVRTSSYMENADGSAWSQTFERGQDGRLDGSNEWVPENSIARDQVRQRRQANGENADGNNSNDNSNLESDLHRIYGEDQPNTPPPPEDENGNDQPGLPPPQQLTGRIGAPRTCGEITDPDEAVAMGCVPASEGETIASVNTAYNSSAQNGGPARCYQISDYGAAVALGCVPAAGEANIPVACGLINGWDAAVNSGCVPGDVPWTGATARCTEINDEATALAVGCDPDSLYGADQGFDRTFVIFQESGSENASGTEDCDLYATACTRRGPTTCSDISDEATARALGCILDPDHPPAPGDDRAAGDPLTIPVPVEYGTAPKLPVGTINELTAAPRPPRTCGEITDRDEAVAMGCVRGPTETSSGSDGATGDPLAITPGVEYGIAPKLPSGSIDIPDIGPDHVATPELPLQSQKFEEGGVRDEDEQAGTASDCNALGLATGCVPREAGPFRNGVPGFGPGRVPGISPAGVPGGNPQ